MQQQEVARKHYASLAEYYPAKDDVYIHITASYNEIVTGIRE